MSEDQGNPNVPSGELENGPADQDLDKGLEATPSNNVSYETHRKLLGEKKKLKERLDALERQQHEAAQKDLEENQKWKELADLKAKEAGEYKEKYSSLEGQLAEGRKLTAILEALPASVDKKYWGLIDTNDVVFNPETGEVEASSVQAVAKKIQESFPEIISTQRSTGQPAASPAAAPSGSMTIEEWKKLPYAERVKPEVRAKVKLGQ